MVLFRYFGASVAVAGVGVAGAYAMREQLPEPLRAQLELAAQRVSLPQASLADPTSIPASLRQQLSSYTASGASSIPSSLSSLTASGETDTTKSAAAVIQSLNNPSLGTYDFVVVGGGVLGTAVARQLLLEYPSRTVCLVEKEPTAAVHQSSHNSGVIHAGIYDKATTLKGQLCVRGNRMVYEFCDRAGIPCKRVGKLVVATSARDLPKLDEYKANGEACGQTDLEIVSGPEAVKKLEPNVNGIAALVSKNTGIVDFAALTRRLADEITGRAPLTELTKTATRKVDYREARKKSKRGSIYFNKEVTQVADVGPYCQLTMKEPDQAGPAVTMNARVVVTAAGLQMDTVGRLAGGRPEPATVPFRGRYYQLTPQKKDIVSANIYPCPPYPGDVGVHFTPTVDEARGPATIVGPSFALALGKEAYTATDISPSHVFTLLTSKSFWSFAQTIGTATISAQVMRDLSKVRFVEEARRLVPDLTMADFEESFAGVMAHSLDAKTGMPGADFVFEVTTAVRHPALEAVEIANSNVLRRPVPRVVNVRNAPSPAATASLAIAEHVASLVESDLKVALV